MVLTSARRKMTRAGLIALFLGSFLARVDAATPTPPTFYARQDYVGLFSQWVSIADTNGDGIPDMIASDNGAMSVQLGNGDGTFRTGPVSLTSCEDAQIMVDLNGDGKADLLAVAISGNSAGVAACIGNGDGTFEPGQFYPAGAESSHTVGYQVVGDFNGDGIPDAALIGGSGLWLFTGRGDGTFNPGVIAAPVEPGGGPIAAAGFNGDGNLDVVVGISFTKADGFFVLFGNGDGTFQTPQHFTEPSQPIAIAAGPLGGHKFPGIALSVAGEPQIALYFGNGKGGFVGPKYLAMGANEISLAIGDVNGDGIPDVVTADGEAYVALGNAFEGFSTPVAYPVQVGEGIYNLALSDLRNDGRIDIITDSQFGNSVLLNNGKGRFEDGLFTTLSVGAGCGVAADFNRDGKPDIAVNTSQGISILLGTGKPAALFTVGESIALPGAGCLTQARDINGDGITDLVITSPTAVVAYLGNGDGTFTLKSSTPVPGYVEYVVLADFNHDGKLDFATNGNQLALGNGDGTFQTPAPFVSNPPAGGYNNIAIGDVNNDGWVDIVLTNLDLPYSNVYVGLNNHAGGFTQVATTYGENASEAVLVDLNGDGNLDMVLNTNVYLGDGKGNFTLQTTLGYPVSYGGPLSSMVADVNGDGIPDIGVLGGGSVEIYLGEGGAKYATPFYLGTGPAPGSIFAVNLLGQKASKGLPDLVAPDLSGGVEVLLNLTK